MSEKIIRINEIQHADSVANGDLLLGVNAQNKEMLYSAITFKGADGVGIANIVKVEDLPNGDANWQITYQDGRTPTVFTLKKGEKGDKGDTGNGFAIRRIFNSAIEMVTAAASIDTGVMCAVLTQAGADVYIRNPEQTADGKHQPGFTFFTTLSEASVIRGDKGDKGDKGDTGPMPILSIGTITILEPDEEASAEITPGGVINLALPRGQRGYTGNDGRSITSLALTPMYDEYERVIGNRLTIAYNDELYSADILSGTTIDAADQSAINWAREKREAELSAEALAKFDISTTASGQSYVADQQSTTTMVVTATLTFDNVAVDADETPTGWLKTPNTTGVYTKTIGNAATGTVAAQSFDYTPGAGKYAGIKCTKSSTAKSIVVVYPIWFGFIPSNVAADFISEGVLDVSAAGLSGLTRQTTNKTINKGALNNGTANTAWYWALTHNNATAVDTMTSANMFNSKVDTKVLSNGYTLNGYKLFISKASATAGGDLSSNCTVNISI